MTGFEQIGAFQSSSYPPPEILREFIHDTRADEVLKA
jgi:hypothetical protein